MKTYCQLGNIKFDFLNSPVANETEGRHTFAELKPALGIPVLHDKGEELETKKLTFQFHRKFCDPESMHQLLIEARKSAEVLPLVYANGNYYGDFVIETIRRTDDKDDGTGNVLSIDVEVSLKAVFENSLKVDKKAKEKGGRYKKEAEGSGGKKKEDVSINEIVRV